VSFLCHGSLLFLCSFLLCSLMIEERGKKCTHSPSIRTAPTYGNETPGLFAILPRLLRRFSKEVLLYQGFEDGIHFMMSEHGLYD
jgi:hypothetical protein